MFKIKFWWNKKEKEEIKQTVETFAIRCSSCGKETMIDVNLLDTTYQEIVKTFVLNTTLHHVGMVWMIENNEELIYDMDILNSDCLTVGPWHTTYICKNLHGKLFEGCYKL